MASQASAHEPVCVHGVGFEASMDRLSVAGAGLGSLQDTAAKANDRSIMKRRYMGERVAAMPLSPNTQRTLSVRSLR